MCIIYDNERNIDSPLSTVKGQSYDIIWIKLGIFSGEKLKTNKSFSKECLRVLIFPLKNDRRKLGCLSVYFSFRQMGNFFLLSFLRLDIRIRTFIRILSFLLLPFTFTSSFSLCLGAPKVWCKQAISIFMGSYYLHSRF